MRVNGWSVAVAVLACACQAASPGRDTAEPPPSTAAAAPAPSVAPTSPAQDVPSVEGLQAIAPELSARSAARLIEVFGRSGQTAEAVAESGLVTASQGFRTLDDGTVREVGAVLAEAYATLAPADRMKLGSYVDRVRSGDAVGDEARDGRRLFTQAVANLDAGRRSRLQGALRAGHLRGPAVRGGREGAHARGAAGRDRTSRAGTHQPGCGSPEGSCSRGRHSLTGPPGGRRGAQGTRGGLLAGGSAASAGAGCDP